MQIRAAKPGDEQAIFSLIKELALYEKAPQQVSNTAEQLSIDLFQSFLCEAIVAENDKEIIPLVYGEHILDIIRPYIVLQSYQMCTRQLDDVQNGILSISTII